MPKDTLSKCYPILTKAGYEFEREDLYLGRGRRRDFAGFADILAWKPDWSVPGMLAIQSCMEQHLVPHMESMGNNEKLYGFMSPTRRIELWCWAKRKRNGRDKLVLRPFRVSRYAEDAIEFHEGQTEIPYQYLSGRM